MNCLICMCPQPNAHEEAEVELKRIQELELEEMRRREEQLEKAHLRGKQALRREHLVQVQLSKYTANTKNVYSSLNNDSSVI